jgi:hypothetical protein
MSAAASIVPLLRSRKVVETRVNLRIGRSSSACARYRCDHGNAQFPSRSVLSPRLTALTSVQSGLSVPRCYPRVWEVSQRRNALQAISLLGTFGDEERMEP